MRPSGDLLSVLTPMLLEKENLFKPSLVNELSNYPLINQKPNQNSSLDVNLSLFTTVFHNYPIRIEAK